MPDKIIPSLYTWLGGMNALENLINVFYDKVEKDDFLQEVFKNMSHQHRQHVAHFIAEVFGGPTTYSESEGSHYEMIHKHLNRQLTEQQRQRWMQLLLQTADEVGIPSDPEFRSSLISYLEWGTRIAVINSHASEVNMQQHQPMPKWGWGETGGPYQP